MSAVFDDTPIAVVDLEAPARWLFSGWADFKKAMPVSLTYGALFVIAGYALVWMAMQASMIYVVMPLIGGFALFAPFMSLGLYEVSSQLEKGEKPTFFSTWDAWRKRPRRVGLMVMALLIVMMAWFLIGSLVFGIAVGSGTHSIDGVVEQLLTSEGFAMIMVGSLIGLFFAAVVFLCGAISFPSLIDRDLEPVEAVMLSIRAVLRNSHVMWSWAFTIALLVWFGISLALVGLAVAVPVLAYATWHAYRELVPPQEA
ncbi:MAG: DUF2189 domain-containing protein [Magnetospiraceae bacterium]